MRLDDKIKRFLRSEYGVKILKSALLHGQESIKLDRTNYNVSELLRQAEALKLNPEM